MIWLRADEDAFYPRPIARQCQPEHYLPARAGKLRKRSGESRVTIVIRKY
ncbi:MAG TPA: hypothetical protein VGR92_20005 [Steroidobacteraceae bacterium]|nr:hypothetical protein [Steroidobacteraceae bacterium]